MAIESMSILEALGNKRKKKGLLSSEVKVLVAISESNKHLCDEIACVANMHKTSTQQTLGRLKEQGYVLSDDNPVLCKKKHVLSEQGHIFAKTYNKTRERLRALQPPTSMIQENDHVDNTRIETDSTSQTNG